ncbi:hypothetical protein FBU30_008782 [Linnemannia zychae]|nr:hypothetical protein FBU30_008782 [Linnemannia zychae]
MAEETLLQSFRRGPSSRILQVEVHHHTNSNQHIVFWDDILEAFPGANIVLNGTVVVTRARDASLKFIEPRCIKYQPGIVLEVVGGEDLTLVSGGSTLAPTPTPERLTYQNIAQWSAKITSQNTLESIYAPTICTLTTSKTQPFKLLLLPTEADLSSIKDDSDIGADKEDEKNNNIQEPSHDTEDSGVGSLKEKENTDKAPSVTTSNEVLMTSAPNVNYILPQHAIPETEVLIYPDDNSAFTNDVFHSTNTFSGTSGYYNGQISLAPLSITASQPSLSQPSSPPTTKSPKKQGFLKSTFNRLRRKTSVTPVVVALDEISQHSQQMYPSADQHIASDNFISSPTDFSTHNQFPISPVVEFLPQMSSSEQQYDNRWNMDGESDMYSEEVNYDEMFRQVEAESARKREEERLKLARSVATITAGVPAMFIDSE